MGRESPRRFKIIEIIPSKREYVFYNPRQSGRHTSYLPPSPQNPPPVQIIQPPPQAPIPQIQLRSQIAQIGPTIPIPQQNSQIVFSGSQTLDQVDGLFDTFIPNDQEGDSLFVTEDHTFNFTEDF